jgi:type I restriction-modification system DNA methylase subunit
LQDFLKYNLEKEKIGTAEDLSTELAIRCHRLYEYSLLALKQEKEDKGIKQLYDLFKEKFFEDLKQDDFSKSFSQMITFTSLLAKLHTDSNSNNPNENIITISNLKEHIPESFIVLHDLIKFFEGLENLQQDGEEDAYSLMHWVVNDEILAVINAIDTFALNEQLSYCGGSKYKDNDEGLFSRDPYIYFYEEFLQKFDKKERQIRGAYYTPPPVVKYIISGINEILKDNFDIHEGLANENITLLDFAVGTGTFLVEVFKQIFDELKELNTSQTQIDSKIRNHILQNFFGFEYMISPFTISYLKLTRMIEDYDIADEKFKSLVITVLELATQSHELFVYATLSEKRSLIDFVFSDMTLTGRNLHYTLRKPFDLIVDLSKCEDWLPNIEEFRIFYPQINSTMNEKMYFEFENRLVA